MPFPRGGWTPLMYAAREGALDAARALAELGADLNVVALPQTDVALTDAVRTAANHVGTTALVYAIINAHFDLAAMLIDAGANPNIVDHERDGGAVRGGRDGTPCSGCRAGRRRSGRTPSTGTQAGQRLLAHGADPNAKLSAAPSEDFPRPWRHPQLQPRHDAADARRADQRRRGDAAAARRRRRPVNRRSPTEPPC